MPALAPLRIQLKVIAGASRTGVEWYGDKLKVKVSVAPEKGRANTAVIALLAQRLGLPLSAFRIVAGETNPLKTVEIHGLGLAQLQQVLKTGLR